MPTAVDAVLKDLVQWARAIAEPGQRRILGITGPPGAGKSTVAAQLAAALGPDAAVLVPMDGFHLSNAVLERLGRRAAKGAVDTFDDAGYAALLERLRAQRPGSAEVVYAPDFDRSLEESIGSALPVSAQVPLIITEGNYLLEQSGAWLRARACMDEVWYLETDDAVRRERLIARHELHGKSPDEARAWALGSDEANARTIAAVRERADRILLLR